MNFAQRTHDCGSLRLADAGQRVTLNGWAHRVRNLGGLFFIDFRDRTGLIQLFFDPQRFPNLDIRNESCLTVTGTVQPRDEQNRNPKLPTGDVDVVVEEFEILNQAAVLPFPVSDEDQMLRVNEELRVRYRYIDLRRPSMYRKLALRAAAIRKIRAYLDSKNFLEIETPIITKSTPEGARDYLVPYRLDPGKFYALPQSPQQYKQLLMVAGLERYYQIAKCFRDESQRSDRQPEFTQLDLEMSFATQEDILNLIEGMTLSVVNELITEFNLEKDPVVTFQRLTYDESLARYGSDKPDLRFGLELVDITDIVRESPFTVFKSAAESGGVVRGIRYPGAAMLSRKDVTELEDCAKSFGAKGMAWFGVVSEEIENSVPIGNGLFARGGCSKFLAESERAAIVTALQAEPGDLVAFVADEFRATCEPLNRLRNLIGEKTGLRDQRKLAFGFVVDFPLVEWNADEQRWDPTHHPFTAPKAADLEHLEEDPAKVRADCYDVVCNGYEWASGSIRIHRPDVQSRVFKLIGVDEQTQKERFGHMLDAFSLGAPPHGGIAPGIDRLIMFLLDEENIREVIAFPKMGNGYDPMMDAPSPIDPEQWAEMGLTPPPKKNS